MRILVVDDENLARDRLVRMINNIPGHEVVGEAAHGLAAVQSAATTLPDVVLLDIRMPGMDGLEAARHLAELDEPPAVIFCTAYEEHAIEAFDLQAVGYLLKPVRRENLENALVKTQRVNKAQLAGLSGDQARRSHISVRTRRGVELIAVDDIRYFQADQKYVTVRNSEAELIIDETLRELEDEFADLFVRVHRNALVAAQHIEGLDKTDDGHVQVRLTGIDEKLDISRRHLAAVRKFVKRL